MDPREIKLRHLVSLGLHPDRWTMSFPGGYKVHFRVVGPKYPPLGGQDGMSYHFGSVDHDQFEPLDVKEARVYFNKSMTIDRFLHVLFHEVYHTITEWSGDRHQEMLEMRDKLLDEV